MRYATPHGAEFAKGDMTPMIDMTFQLIAFFMVLVNFSDVDQAQRINLPLSELAKPPDVATESFITLQLTKEGTVILSPNEVKMEDLGKELLREKQVFEATGERDARNATIIIRADKAAKTGEVQEIIEICQKTGFEKFTLRAKQESA